MAAAVRRESGALLDYFVRRTPVREDAADLLGETLVVVWRKARSLPVDPTEARMWMFGIARRVLSQNHRSGTRRRALAERLADHLRSSGAPSDDDHPDVREAIARLEEIDQEIIRLVYWDGFSLVEAARVLKMNAATVRSRHARARARLQTALGSEAACV
ncbi:sigma-70 family RNA polymerase sigma factor [Microbacterium sp. NPDC089189]|uniref:RNA polymerase sigma factor n=1 Tax=Microbacterium sp. NPDC089189 TaxID=3154972 RepID=UPI003415EFF1